MSDGEGSDYREIVEFFDHEYVGLDLLGPDVEFFLEHMPGGPSDPYDVLELGCGTGRATRQIAAEGHRVWGVDVDPKLLAIAESHRDTRYTEADLSVAGWDDALPNGANFDAICCFFNTFLAMSTPEAQEHCLLGARRRLDPGGFLWLDIFHPNLDLIVGSVGGADELEPDLFHLPDGRTILRTTSLYASVTQQVQHVTFHYAWFDADGEPRETDRSFDLAWIMPREMERLLRLCGFRVVETFGDHDGGPLVDESERQIIKAVAIDP